MQPADAPSQATLLGGHRQLVEARLRERALCGGDVGDLGPNLEGLAAGGSTLGSEHLMAAKVEKVVDPVMGGQEAPRLPG